MQAFQGTCRLSVPGKCSVFRGLLTWFPPNSLEGKQDGGGGGEAAGLALVPHHICLKESDILPDTLE